MSTVINNNKVLEEVREQIVLTKPSVNDLFTTYIDCNIEIQDIGFKYFEDEEVAHIVQKWHDIIEQNNGYLSLMKPKDFNITNFNKLIASIELNGSKHFNMQLFLGILEDISDYDEDEVKTTSLDGFETVSAVSCDYLSPLDSETRTYSAFISTTKAFNCSTVGCIAGFAMAVALDWKEDLIVEASRYYSNQQVLFEQVACNFLNMPVIIGRKLFYGEANSIWAMLCDLKDRNPNATELDVFRKLEQPYNYGDGDDERYPEIDMASINYSMAAKVLELIRDGDIYLDTNTMPVISDKYEMVIAKSNKIQNME